jgi:hypothetical protein
MRFVKPESIRQNLSFGESTSKELLENLNRLGENEKGQGRIACGA